LNAAGDHVICLIDSREKEVVGTTYKALKELINDVSNCGYFERALKEENTEECGAEQEFVVVNRQELPEPDSVEVQSSLPINSFKALYVVPTTSFSLESIKQIT
jgi:hypothetical protein